MKHGSLRLVVGVALLLGLSACSSEGSRIYQSDCAGCHARGVGGAPATGNSKLWQKRLDRGVDVLTARSIQGYQGNTGFMPPRGGNPQLTDEQVRAAVVYMIEQSR